MKRAKSPAVRKLFGTDGIRGVANIEPITSEVALRLGRAAAHVGSPRCPWQSDCRWFSE